MPQDNSTYSQTQGVKLLERAVAEFGPIFTLEQLNTLSQVQQISKSHLRFLISSLAAGGGVVAAG
jgi:hypothetical protein